MEISIKSIKSLGEKFLQFKTTSTCARTICALTSLTFGNEFERKEEDIVDTFELRDRTEVWLDIAEDCG